MATEAKVTKKVVLNAIKDYVKEDVTIEVDGIAVTAEDIYDYVDKTIAQLEAKAEKAKETAAKKRAEGDEITKVIEDVLTDEYQTANDIVDAIEDENITRNKVTARIAQLIKAGKAHKTIVKTEDGRKLVAYAAGPAPEEDAE